MRLSIVPTTLLAAFVFVTSDCRSQIRAGAGKSDIKTSAAMWPVNGFTSQHDPLSVRVLLLEDNVRAAIVEIDQTSISDGTIAEVKAVLKRLAEVSPENALVIATHTFSAPHVFGGPLGAAPGGGEPGAQGGVHGPGGPGGAQTSNRVGSPPPAEPGTPLFAKAIDAAVEAATTQARSTLQQVKIGFGLGVSDVAVNRDQLTPRGWWLGGDAAGFSDKALPVVRIDRMDGTPLAILMNGAVQSAIMDQSKGPDGGKVVTADLAGAARQYVERFYSDHAVAFFLIGAAGDQAPVLQGTRYLLHADGSTSREDIHNDGFTLVELLGERLGTEAVLAADSIASVAASGVEIERRELELNSQGQARGLPTEPVQSYTYQPGPKVKLPVVLMRFGDIVIIGLQPELAASIGAKMKAESPFPHTMVVTLVDGGAKYMPDAQSYPRFTYEARNSRYAEGSAEQVAHDVNLLLQQMNASGSRASR